LVLLENVCSCVRNNKFISMSHHVYRPSHNLSTFAENIVFKISL